ncbi:MAG: MoaD/ThiS family protein [Syntrophobacteraceae bacterium]|nr:MoaD/ThiS family protein [Syntrophobacteraceae bacterium]
MPLQVFLAATLRKYLPGYDAGTGHPMEVPEGAAVRDVARRLAIPEEEIKIVMVNGVGAKLDTPLKGDERVALFPPVGGG